MLWISPVHQRTRSRNPPRARCYLISCFQPSPTPSALIPSISDTQNLLSIPVYCLHMVETFASRSRTLIGELFTVSWAYGACVSSGSGLLWKRFPEPFAGHFFVAAPSARRAAAQWLLREAETCGGGPNCEVAMLQSLGFRTNDVPKKMGRKLERNSKTRTRSFKK